ncbi:MAG: ATP-binding response regulator [Actinomycetota bacterium]
MKILLVDDHQSIRKSLKQLLELHSDFQVVGEGANGAEAVACVEESHPDIVLMDMNMPVMNGAEATRVIKERHPEIKVLALTAFADMSLVSEMVKAGASGYLLKGGSARELLDSLEAVARGHAALDKEVTRGVMEDMAELYRQEQERADALAELDRMKREFISVVSHELRTPLTSIKGGTATLRNNWRFIDERTRDELLDSILRQSDQLERMVGRILTVSGIQRGGFGLKPVRFSLGRVAHEAVEILRAKMTGREVRVNAEDVHASGDKERIREVAVALIENALEFTRGRINLRTEQTQREVRLHVIDEGPGMDPRAVQEMLAEPFRPGDSSNTRTVGGLGLSLYLARQVLEASSGRLEIETGPNTGSRFTMVLPRTE